MFGSTDGPGVGAGSTTNHGIIGSTLSGLEEGKGKAGVIGYVRNAGFPTTPDGTGVHGAGPGVGVLATGRQGGTALEADGPVRFSTAGLDTIAKNAASVLVTPGVDITENSKVLATLQSDPGGSTLIQRVDRDPGAGTFTVHLSTPAPKACEVAWFVIS